MRRVDPYNLHLLVAVAHAHSISRAAAKEHIAASALSRRMAELEEGFGVPLLVRTPHGIKLTEAGEIACRRAAELEDNIRSLVREAQGQAGRIAGTLRLYACAGACVGFLPERLQKFVSHHRLVDVVLQETIAEDVVRACLEGSADVGVAEALGDVPGTIESWHFGNDPLVVVMPPDHRLAKSHSLRFRDVLPFAVVIVEPGSAIDRLLHEKALALGEHLRVCVTVQSFDAGCRMVEAGFGISVKPRKAAEVYVSRRRLVMRPLEEDWAANEQRIYALRTTPRLRSVEALIAAIAG